MTSRARTGVIPDAGAVVTDATVRYAIDGGAPKECTVSGEAYTCGWEMSGLFEITATRGDRAASARVRVEDDGCHPIGESVTLTLAP